MRLAACCAALALMLTASLFVLSRAMPAEAFTAYSQELAVNPQSCLGCGCPACPSCSCVRCG
ncbi:MAG: hypothetical protein B193_4005 [Solidesulfovibrio magneticus str. Maddingley MBC34]|uniref:Uncharacterized protein n=1 Tax=Solidesulfovibrio magneticus str. Maddingley MBC34 TaxID=1206767 RepID=K6G891_9BACT|nr:MAG: hypothetical protein B193_4005 [Solidesulfovibrio magneticus str. Maddingley MBC34]